MAVSAGCIGVLPEPSGERGEVLEMLRSLPGRVRYSCIVIQYIIPSTLPPPFLPPSLSLSLHAHTHRCSPHVLLGLGEDRPGGGEGGEGARET